MKYSPPHANLTISLETARRIRWGDSRYAPYWGSRYVEITNPTAGSTYILAQPGPDMYYWCYGWHITATNDGRVSVQDALESRKYVRDLYAWNGRCFYIESATPLFGTPHRITENNPIMLYVGTTFTGKIYCVLLGIDAYESNVEEIP